MQRRRWHKVLEDDGLLREGGSHHFLPNIRKGRRKHGVINAQRVDVVANSLRAIAHRDAVPNRAVVWPAVRIQDLVVLSGER